MNNLKQLFMAGVIVLCAAGMTQAVAWHDAPARPVEPDAPTPTSPDTIIFGIQGGVGSGTMSNSASTNNMTGSVLREVTLTNPYPYITK